LHVSENSWSAFPQEIEGANELVSQGEVMFKKIVLKILGLSHLEEASNMTAGFLPQPEEKQVSNNNGNKKQKLGNLMIDNAKVNGVADKSLPPTTKVGRVVIDGNWHAVFLATTREGEIVRTKDGEVMFNLK
jgi:formylmethanofuran dehydrogenase subunit C